MPALLYKPWHRGPDSQPPALPQTPLWVCLACPIVLGMLIPFALNSVLGEVAQHLCDLYQMPTDECNELWCGPDL